MYTEKLLEENCIFDGRVIKVYNNKVELENGRTVTREVVKHNGGVGVLPVDSEENVYLVRQYRAGASGELLEIPAGKLESGEDPIKCGLRELSEETGFSASGIVSLGYIYPTPGYDTEKIHIFIAKNLQPGQQHMDDDEFLDVVKIPYYKAVMMIENGEITDAKTIIALLRAEKWM